ncbi:hypothetical protein AX769_01235 [Frondihabitans sp. PAMC 28766]|uniref:NmrA family NAD(P)-binding protein n=1 Tax=Frondihabitans sp. PAMC 28766 TaxID=1795630 RepID=UPI00078E2AC1|nr:NmrA family NAD(P)-binding protein [Frondihabitans sp. PAMC 28766]AMM19016.1 hypothetical protein AX769_01235 [Frondihabitans sp. PAMC 28766]
MTQTVLLAGATGNLGSRIATLLSRDEDVALRLLVRPSVFTDQTKTEQLGGLTDGGAAIAEASLQDPEALAAATAGVDVVISCLQGGRDVIVDGQVALAQAAEAAGVRRFIPSDFALDLWHAPEAAPMFALRREADTAIEALDLEVLHVLNGAFMDMMIDPNTAGVVDLGHGTGSYYGSGDDEFDVTLVDDVARFTAALAVDLDARPGVHAISGSRTSFGAIIAEVEEITGRTLERLHRGDAADLRAAITAAASPWAVMGQWYNLSMIETPPFETVENDRYAAAQPTSLADYLRSALA